MSRWPAVLLLVLAGAARAQEVTARGESAEVGPERDYVNLRGGVVTGGSRAQVCLEVSPMARLGVEACGTGSGFLHQDPAPEVAHFRAKLTLDGWRSQLGLLQPQLFVGFAELQVGEDAPGFHFTGTGATGVETAGPEVGAALRGMLPVGAGFELVGTLNLSLSYFSHAPELPVPQRALHPAVSFTVGVGF
jgi:hypothetical protein